MTNNPDSANNSSGRLHSENVLFIFQIKIKLDSSNELSVKQTIHM